MLELLKLNVGCLALKIINIIFSTVQPTLRAGPRAVKLARGRAREDLTAENVSSLLSHHSPSFWASHSGQTGLSSMCIIFPTRRSPKLSLWYEKQYYMVSRSLVIAERENWVAS